MSSEREALPQIVPDLHRAGQTLGDGLGEGDEGVDLAGVLERDDVDPGRAQAIGIGLPLVAEGSKPAVITRAGG